ncbi:hypothetical protein MYP_1475 [Sporocytophaga myxococcoides]|uniref:Helix-turn-helix domain-containing protein n=1 Tax=Sporocytophaga myxococcoides TaxID=153721 RepID=A0A098LCY1_9BACT|nr:helix-turn-helix domain-containing protein [Sporocytophaga myxococcoides]GAL84247.1 hypothetical protein MYP_1475 [Sporocytophaga myxococcoides]
MFLNTSEASDFLNITKNNLYRLIKDKKVKFYKPNGKNLYFKKEDLISYIERGVYE